MFARANAAVAAALASATVDPFGTLMNGKVAGGTFLNHCGISAPASTYNAASSSAATSAVFGSFCGSRLVAILRDWPEDFPESAFACSRET